MLVIAPAANFCQTRGTAWNMLGWTSNSVVESVSSPSPVWTTMRDRIGEYSAMIRSKACASERCATTRTSPRRCNSGKTVQSCSAPPTNTLRWVIIAALDGPVVPDVKMSIAGSSTDTVAATSSTISLSATICYWLEQLLERSKRGTAVQVQVPGYCW